MPSRTEPRPARPIPIRRGLPGEDGNSVGIEDVRPVLEQLVEAKVPAVVDAVVKLLPPPQKGDKGTDGEDGKSVSLEEVRPLVLQAVREIPLLKGDQGIKGDSGKDAPLPKGWRFVPERDANNLIIEIVATPIN